MGSEVLRRFAVASAENDRGADRLVRGLRRPLLWPRMEIGKETRSQKLSSGERSGRLGIGDPGIGLVSAHIIEETKEIMECRNTLQEAAPFEPSAENLRG